MKAVTYFADGQITAATHQDAIDIRLEEPASQYYIIPSDFQELTPSAFWEAQVKAQSGVPNPHDLETFQRFDLDYANNKYSGR